MRAARGIQMQIIQIKEHCKNKMLGSRLSASTVRGRAPERRRINGAINRNARHAVQVPVPNRVAIVQLANPLTFRCLSPKSLYLHPGHGADAAAGTVFGWGCGGDPAICHAFMRCFALKGVRRGPPAETVDKWLQAEPLLNKALAASCPRQIAKEMRLKAE
jgi:hypothetical protein